MDPFYYPLDSLRNLTGTYFSIFENKFLITTYDDNPIIIYLKPRKIYENNLKNSERLLTSKDKLEIIIECFNKITHIAWLNSFPVLVENINVGTKLKFDAILEHKVGYQAILMWNGAKPKSCPVLNENEILFVQEFVHLPIQYFAFEKAGPVIHIEIDGYIMKLPFSCNCATINGVAFQSNEELMTIYSKMLPRKPVATVSKFISYDGHYLYICSHVSIERSDMKIAFQSESGCGKSYKNSLIDLIPIKNSCVVYFDVEFELNIIGGKYILHFMVDHIAINLPCDFDGIEPAFGKAHMLHIDCSYSENYWHVIVLEIETKESGNFFPSLITLKQNETLGNNSYLIGKVFKLVDYLGTVVSINLYLKYISVRSIAIKASTNNDISVKESKVLLKFPCNKNCRSIRKNENFEFMTKELIKNIESHYQEMKTITNDCDFEKNSLKSESYAIVPVRRNNHHNEVASEIFLACQNNKDYSELEEEFVEMSADVVNANVSLNENENLKSKINLKLHSYEKENIEKMNGNYLCFQEIKHDPKKSRKGESEANAEIIKQDYLDSKINFKINKTDHVNSRVRKKRKKINCMENVESIKCETNALIINQNCTDSETNFHFDAIDFSKIKKKKKKKIYKHFESNITECSTSETNFHAIDFSKIKKKKKNKIYKHFESNITECSKSEVNLNVSENEILKSYQNKGPACSTVIKNPYGETMECMSKRYIESKERNNVIYFESTINKSSQNNKNESSVGTSMAEKIQSHQLGNINKCVEEFEESYNEQPINQTKFLKNSKISSIIKNLRLGQYSSLIYLNQNEFIFLRNQLNSELYNDKKSLPQYIRKGSGKLLYFDDLKVNFIICELFGHYLILFPNSYTLHYHDGVSSTAKNCNVNFDQEVYFDAVFDSIESSYVPVLVYDKSDDILSRPSGKEIILNNYSYYYDVKGIYKGLFDNYVKADIAVYGKTFQISAILVYRCIVQAYIRTFPLHKHSNTFLHLHLQRDNSTNEWKILFIFPLKCGIPETESFSRKKLLISTNYSILSKSMSKNGIIQNAVRSTFLLRNYKAIVSEKSAFYITLIVELPNGNIVFEKIFKNYSIFDNKSWVPASLLPMSSVVYFDGIVTHEISFLLIWKSVKPEKKTGVSVTNYFSVPGRIISSQYNSITVDLYLQSPEDCYITKSPFQTNVFDQIGLPFNRLMLNDIILADVTKCRKKGYFISVIYQLSNSDAIQYLHLFSNFINRNKIIDSDVPFIENSLTLDSTNESRKNSLTDLVVLHKQKTIKQVETTEVAVESVIHDNNNKSKNLFTIQPEINKETIVSKFYMPCTCEAQGSQFAILNAKNFVILLFKEDFCRSTSNYKEARNLELTKKQVSAYVVLLDNSISIEELNITHRALVAWLGKKSKCEENVDNLFISRYEIFIKNSNSIMAQVEANLKLDIHHTNSILQISSKGNHGLPKFADKVSNPTSSITLHEELCSPNANDLHQSFKVHSYKTSKGKVKNVNIYYVLGIVVHLSDHEGILSIQRKDESVIRYSYFQKKVCFINGEWLIDKSNSVFRKFIKSCNTLAADVYKCQIQDHYGYEITYSVASLYNSRKPEGTDYVFLKEPFQNYSNFIDTNKNYTILQKSVATMQPTNPSSSLYLLSESVKILKSNKH